MYVEEVKSNLQDISYTASHQYDSIFLEIFNTIDHTLQELKNPIITSQDMSKLLRDSSNRSYYVKDMVILSEDGQYVTSQVPEHMINPDDVMDYFQKDKAHTGFVKATSENNNIYYATKKFELSNQEVLLMVGLDFDQINGVVHPERYNLHNGYLFLVSHDGFILYHIDRELMGKNIFVDSTSIRRLTKMNVESYKKLSNAVVNTNSEKDQYYIKYSGYGTDKMAYYNYLEVFPGVSFLTIDYTTLLHNQLQSIFRTIIPLIICLAVATYLFLRYIYLIKYTDYFTEVKNEHAFRRRIKKFARKGYVREHYLIVEIINVSSNRHKDFLYDNQTFYQLSHYFKKISSLYTDLYRISRVHYMFVLKDNYNESDVRKLLSYLNDDVNIKGDQPLYIRGKKLIVTLDRLNELKHFEVDCNILNHMVYENSDLADYDNLTVIKYSHIITGMIQRLNEKMYLEDAILNNHFVPYYQPIIDLETNKVYKHEVLMRIADQNDSYSTEKLIKVAEEENMVEKIDRAMIQQSFYQYNKELNKTRKSIRLSINLSGKSINQKMVDYIQETAKKCKVIPSHITFELTETAALNNLDASIKSLSTLREMGFQLAIDDFGTGYAHVELLSKLPVDYIKIDGTFILNVERDEQKLKTLNALVYIAKNYNAKIIAEFVENENVVHILKKLGIEYGQGFYFGKPREDALMN